MYEYVAQKTLHSTHKWDRCDSISLPPSIAMAKTRFISLIFDFPQMISPVLMRECECRVTRIVSYLEVAHTVQYAHENEYCTVLYNALLWRMPDTILFALTFGS